MKCYLYGGERLVFEGEGWGVIVDDNIEARGYGACEYEVYATHQKCTVDAGVEEDSLDGRCHYGEDCWWPGVSPAICKVCEETVPEGVQGLILMVLWDKGCLDGGT